MFFRDIKQYLNFEKIQILYLDKMEGYLSTMFISFIFLQITQIRNDFTAVGETVIFLQDIVQVKVNNIIHVINVTSNNHKSKQVNDVIDRVATII